MANLINYTLGQKKVLYSSLNRQVRQGHGNKMTSFEWELYYSLQSYLLGKKQNNLK